MVAAALVGASSGRALMAYMAGRLPLDLCWFEGKAPRHVGHQPLLATHFHPKWNKSLHFPYVGIPVLETLEQIKYVLSGTQFFDRRPRKKVSGRSYDRNRVSKFKSTIRKPAGTVDDGDHGLHPRTRRTTAATRCHGATISFRLSEQVG